MILHHTLVVPATFRQMSTVLSGRFKLRLIVLGKTIGQTGDARNKELGTLFCLARIKEVQTSVSTCRGELKKHNTLGFWDKTSVSFFPEINPLKEASLSMVISLKTSLGTCCCISIQKGNCRPFGTSRSFGISNESVNIPDIIHHICQSFSTLPSNFPPRWVCLKIRWPQNYCFHFPCVDFQARPGFHFLSCLVNLSIYGKRSSNRLKCPSKPSRVSHQVVPGHPRSRLPTNWHAFHCH